VSSSFIHVAHLGAYANYVDWLPFGNFRNLRKRQKGIPYYGNLDILDALLYNCFVNKKYLKRVRQNFYVRIRLLHFKIKEVIYAAFFNFGEERIALTVK